MSSISYVFNPFTGNFDAVYVPDVAAPAIPITVAEDTVFTAPADYVTYIPHIMRVKGIMRIDGVLRVGG